MKETAFENESQFKILYHPLSEWTLNAHVKNHYPVPATVGGQRLMPGPISTAVGGLPMHYAPKTFKT